MDKRTRIKELILLLNEASKAYYAEDREIMSNFEYDALYDEMFIEDSVTGNASGSYTFNTWEAEENICHNHDLLKDAQECFGCLPTEYISKGAEWADVTIRCYLLGQALQETLEDLQSEV